MTANAKLKTISHLFNFSLQEFLFINESIGFLFLDLFTRERKQIG
jgi:hypothetical protein